MYLFAVEEKKSYYRETYSYVIELKQLFFKIWHCSSQ